jgi:hypothetical protein
MSSTVQRVHPVAHIPCSALGDQTPAERALGSGWDALPAVSVERQGTTPTAQGHRLNFSVDPF